MRISDWSSDVCSSDLERAGQGQQFHPVVAARGCARRGGGRCAGDEDGNDMNEGGTGVRTLLVVEDDAGLQAQLKWAYEDYRVLVAGDHDAALEIGRASLRERWCQYV